MNLKIKEMVDKTLTEVINAPDIFAHTRAAYKLLGISDTLAATELGSDTHHYVMNAMSQAQSAQPIFPAA